MATLLVDDLLDEYNNKPWDSSLVFPGTVLCFASDPPETHRYNEKGNDVDIFNYTSAQFKGLYIRFDPKTYNVHRVESDDKFAKNTDGWELLQNISKSLVAAGQGAFVLNGSKARSSSKNKKYSQHEICCTRYRTYQARRSSDDPLRVKNIVLRQTNKGNTGDRNYNRSTSTSLALSNTKRCTCHMTIHADEIGYFILGGAGNPRHIYHPPVDPNFLVTKLRHIAPESIKAIQEYAFCNATIGSGMLVSSVRHNLILSRRQCQSIMQNEHLKVAFEEVLESSASSWTAPEQMVHLFKQKKILFGMLYHKKSAAEPELPGFAAREKERKKTYRERNNENKVNVALTDTTFETEIAPSEDSTLKTSPLDITAQDPGVCIFETFPPTTNHDTDTNPVILIEDAKPIEYANQCRIATDIHGNQDIVLSLIWSMPNCRRLFQAYPEVMFVDGTHKTNNEKYPLFTVGIRDENFNVIVILRAFCPNERGWMFEWLFKEAIPSILGKDVCKKVGTIITDGDSQETTELDAAIAMGVYGDAKRRRCGWHVLHQGIKNILFQKFISVLDKSADVIQVVGHVKGWIQESLMKNVETELEYHMYVLHTSRLSFLRRMTFHTNNAVVSTRKF